MATGAKFLARCIVSERLPKVCIAAAPPAPPVLAFTLSTSMHCWQEQGWVRPAAGKPPLEVMELPADMLAPDTPTPSKAPVRPPPTPAPTPLGRGSGPDTNG